MDGIALALSPAPAPALAARLSPEAPGWSLSGIGLSSLVAACTVVLFLYLSCRFLWLYNKEAAASATTPAVAPPPADRPRRAVPLPLLPVFVHMGGAAAECAVCLSELREREAGRLLPGCGHGFHEECIVTWLRLSTTCPLCRASVSAKTGDASDASRTC